jgi:uncharacterized membrane protein
MSNRNKNKSVSTKKTPQKQVTNQVTHQQFSGPIPPPSILSGYDSIVPGAAERILRMAEEDASHQRNIEHLAITSTKSEVRLGQFFGLIVSLSALALAGFAVLHDQPWVATLLGGGTLVGIISAFHQKSK